MIERMRSRSQEFRVMLTAPNQWGDVLETFFGVVDYKAGIDHWRLMNDHRPAMPFGDIDLGVVDGVVGYIVDPEWADRLLEAGVAAVNLSSFIEGLPIPLVCSDDEAIGRLGAMHLLERGFSHLAFAGSHGSAAPRRGWHSRMRCQGFQKVVEEKAGRPCNVLALPGIQQKDSSPLDDWLRALPKPVGLMASTDSLARRVIEQVVRLGMRVPDDIAVLGVDNDTWITHSSMVPLSSIDRNARQIGYQGARLLDQLLRKTEVLMAHCITPGAVVERQSTRITLTQDPLVTDALAFVRDYCTEGIDVEDVVRHVGVSRSTLENRLKSALGRSPHTVICEAQVEVMKRMLADPQMPIKEIAMRCGFDRQPRFFEVFKRVTGMTPSAYRQQLRSR